VAQASMRWLRAPAKLNLTLRVVGRRSDGYHELESLVAFAGLCDWLGFDPGDDLSLEVFGPRAGEAGPVHENLVVRGARSLAAQIPGLRLGRFRLIKRIPAAAGLGGGSADAAAALRLLATEVGSPLDDPRVLASARATGADVLACLAPQARTMRGIGDELGPAVRLPRTFVVLVNPQVQAPTPKVFAALDLASEPKMEPSAQRAPAMGFGSDAVLDFRAFGHNDLEAAAIRVAPQIETVLKRLSKIADAKAFGMSGSGATCFALFSDRCTAAATQRSLAAEYPEWWIKATKLR
jgi:4-diphosphocytidyl-2-C-methyl-D-erythritol kinase